MSFATGTIIEKKKQKKKNNNTYVFVICAIQPVIWIPVSIARGTVSVNFKKERNMNLLN